MARMISLIVAVVLLALILLFLGGPRVATDTTITFDGTLIGEDPTAWLATREAKVPDLRAELAKEVVWADPASKAPTPLAIVYIHGFSASKAELRPVPDRVAAEFGANIFYTRLAGHGRDGAAMAEATLNAWINDYAEAIAIGRAIGERVVVIATSTGAALATWGATQADLSRDVAGYVLVSPNYGVQATGAWVLTMPWGRQVAEMVLGPERGFKPISEQHARYWTTRYPTSATLPMAALTDLARQAPVERAAAPALFIFSDADRIVRPDLTRDMAARWGGRLEMMVVEGADDPSNHVIAGDAVSPSTTTLVAGRISQWIATLRR